MYNSARSVFINIMDNQRIAEMFYEISEILEIQGAIRFRVLAYQKAARTIEDLGRDLEDIYKENPKKLQEIPGIGKDLAAKIVEMLTTGKCQFYENLLQNFDRNLLELLRVRGIGPKKVQLFYSKLGIDSVPDLKKAAEQGKLRDLPGMGEKSERDILKALSEYDLHRERMTLFEALKQAEKLVEYLKKSPEVKRAEYAGSLRRMKETIGDIDILCAAKKHNGPAGKKSIEAVMKHFMSYADVLNVIAKGDTKCSVVLKSGLQADLRVIDENVFGAALHYFTGSKAHNVTIRDRAKKMGLKISEYGVFKLKKIKGKDQPKEILIAGKTEEEVFESVGLPYIIPEMREDRGEIEIAQKGQLPKPVEFGDLRGDLHVHSRWSDGSEEIEVIARAYRDAGYEYIALTDHSQAMAMVHGLNPARFKMQWDEIDEINSDLEKEAKDGKPPFRILKGVECDILQDGKMDLPDSCLKKMDIVIASVHSRFNLSEAEQTARIIRALQNPYVKILGHPLGRLINEREPYALDVDAVIEAAIKNGVALEINSQPSRLDLFDYYCKTAKEKGAKFSIDADNHHTTQMNFLRFGIAVAKRGWLEKKDVINSMSLYMLMNWLKNKKLNNLDNVM